MKVSRREFASLTVPAVAALPAAAQTAVSSPAAPADLDAARARMKSNSETLAKQTVPMDVEPAFQFKA